MEKETKWGVALLVLVAAFLGVVLASGILPSDLKQQYAANEATISSLRASLGDTEQKEADTTPQMTPEEEETALASASEACCFSSSRSYSLERSSRNAFSLF